MVKISIAVNPINIILQQIFVKDSFKINQCAEALEYMLIQNDQIECIQNYCWSNMFNDIQKYINNCELCQTTKYERNPYQIVNKLTPNSDFSFDIEHLDILIFTREKYLTIINIYIQH